MIAASRPRSVDFIEDQRIDGLLEQAQPDPVLVREILAKSLAKQRLEPVETAVLLKVTEPHALEELFAAARRLKQEVYGNRIVLFAPLYIGDKCVNDCSYCGFRRSNREVVRKTLTEEELRGELVALLNQGHKRLILVWGEHPNYAPEVMARTIRQVYETKVGKGEIRRVNVNAAPLSVEGYRTVKAVGIGTYQVFQETYHHETYRQVHPAATRKADYAWRLAAHDRAMEAGVDDVGIGVLFGLYDWRFEVIGLLKHAIHLEERYGVGPHTISFPRLNLASSISFDRTWLVSDEDFMRLVAILRLSVPYTGLILTARERPELRREVLKLGISQIDAGSRIEIGGYANMSEYQDLTREQFELRDLRTLDEVVRELIGDGHIPSWCTACYRLGRTGEHFMEFSKPGFIKRFCTPNALLTLAEYLTDYATEATKRDGLALIHREVGQIEDEKIRAAVGQRIARITVTDERDLYF